MSHYSCPECSGSTTVTETRTSYAHVRRRRRCSNGHRFSTIEIPHDTSERMAGLINWLSRQRVIDDDIAAYAHAQLDHIVYGKVLPSEEGEE
jgi:transcriptional regulator NrdR family protein